MKIKIAAEKKELKKIQNIVITSSLIYYLPGNTCPKSNRAIVLIHKKNNSLSMHTHLLSIFNYNLLVQHGNDWSVSFVMSWKKISNTTTRFALTSRKLSKNKFSPLTLYFIIICTTPSYPHDPPTPTLINEQKVCNIEKKKFMFILW